MLYELDAVSRVFKGRKVLDLDRLVIERQKIYGLIGPNGAGKTTLFNILAFLDHPTGGTVRFCGELVGGDKRRMLALRRRVVLVDQQPILFTGPVWKNVEYGLKVRGVAKRVRQKRVDEVLELVGMERFAQADAHKLSGGETSRVALARALAVEPEVLLCDEPTANVDVENQEIVFRILARINREKKTSVLLATHALGPARRLAHHTLMLEHGVLAQTAGENIYRCRVERHDGGGLLCRLSESFSLRLPDHLAVSAQDVKVMIDPAQVQIVSAERADGDNLVPGRVVEIELERGRVRIGLDVGSKLNMVMGLQAYQQSPPIIGQTVTVRVPASGIRVL